MTRRAGGERARRRGGAAWFIVASGLTFAVAAGLAASLIEPRYEAKAVVEFVETADAQAAAERLGADGPAQAAWRRLEGAIENPSILAEGSGAAPFEALNASVSGSRLEISVRAEDPQVAQRVADEAALAARNAGGAVRALTVAGEGRRLASPIPAAAFFAGILGLVVGALAVMLSRLVARRLERFSSPKPKARPQRTVARAASPRESISPHTRRMPATAPAAVRPADAPVDRAQTEMTIAEPERVTLADLAAVLRSTPVSRLLVAAVVGRDGAEGASSRLARMLAAEGAPVLLVAPHAPAAAQEVRITHAAPDTFPDGASLEAVRQTFEHIIVDCTTHSAEEIVALADEECAVVLSCADANEQAVSARMRELGDAGLESVILVRD